ncbi:MULTISPECIES: hypothetical protein [Corynebacterium]|uniref:hypothetical protein n=1 Tax=Corynebacterium TaxID=1716 RepID=UPI0007911899|nr:MULTISPECIES: hypothetical protein [Corynebacterium]KXB52793.1 hypothetical protein HMPREF0307_02111 [Corynebacterium sp. DNF00584]KXI17551.1 hypothetical protein HMPREF3227_01439 [Corynebacterium sp. CMW7794]MBF9011407.1 hypothetical protein [Corynebacterium phoceense]
MSTPNNNDPREGLWDPERRPVKRKRALPKSRVAPTLLAMFALIFIAAVLGFIF